MRTLVRQMREGGLYMLLVYFVALVHSSERLDDPSSFEEDRDHAKAPSVDCGA
jgi:hypothetical protein